MIKHQLFLDYSLAAGWMTTFVNGLLEGKAIARRCLSCARVSFPPERTCTCGSQDSAWVTLSGRAEIVFQTKGTDGHFGLVRFEGADTQTVVRLDDFGDARLGRIAKPDGELPMMILNPIDDDTV